MTWINAYISKKEALAEVFAQRLLFARSRFLQQKTSSVAGIQCLRWYELLKICKIDFNSYLPLFAIDHLHSYAKQPTWRTSKIRPSTDQVIY